MHEPIAELMNINDDDDESVAPDGKYCDCLEEELSYIDEYERDDSERVVFTFTEQRRSCSRVGSRLPCRCASLSLLAVTTAMICCILAPFTNASRRVPLAPSAIFGCFARHRHGVPDRSRGSRACVSACASRAFARLSRGSS